MSPAGLVLDKLRWSLIGFGAALFTGMAILHLASTEAERARNELAQTRMQHQEIRTQLARLADEAVDLRLRIDDYRRIEAHGLIGPERRADWTGDIARIKAARRLLDIQFELTPQRPVDAAILPSPPADGAHDFLSSTMKLRLPLLHEHDLLGFLADLNESARAHILVRTCGIERFPLGTGQVTPQPELRAECTIDWITFRERT